jgi:hypothetical protein
MGRAWVAAGDPGAGEAGGRPMAPGVTHINGSYGKVFHAPGPTRIASYFLAALFPPFSRQIQDNKNICSIFGRLIFSTKIAEVEGYCINGRTTIGSETAGKFIPQDGAECNGRPVHILSRGPKGLSRVPGTIGDRCAQVHRSLNLVLADHRRNVHENRSITISYLNQVE